MTLGAELEGVLLFRLVRPDAAGKHEIGEVKALIDSSLDQGQGRHGLFRGGIGQRVGQGGRGEDPKGGAECQKTEGDAGFHKGF